MNYLYRLARPETPAETNIGKMHPECLKLVSIIQKCKLKISFATANNVVNNDEGNAYNASYIREKSENSNEKRTSLRHPHASQAGGSGKGSRAKWGEVLYNGFLRGVPKNRGIRRKKEYWATRTNSRN